MCNIYLWLPSWPKWKLGLLKVERKSVMSISDLVSRVSCHKSEIPGGLAGMTAFPFDPWPRLSWRRTWQPTPVFLPGRSHGQKSLAGCVWWGHRAGRDWVTQHTRLSCLTVVSVVFIHRLTFSLEGVKETWLRVNFTCMQISSSVYIIFQAT